MMNKEWNILTNGNGNQIGILSDDFKHDVLIRCFQSEDQSEKDDWLETMRDILNGGSAENAFGHLFEVCSQYKTDKITGIAIPCNSWVHYFEVTGDFESNEQKREYCQALCDKLNGVAG